MPEILLTPDLLREEAGKLTNQKNELDSAVQQIQSLVSSLESGWHGKTQQAFVNSFNEKKSVYDKFSNDMMAFITFMNDYASQMEAADDNSRSILNF